MSDDDQVRFFEGALKHGGLERLADAFWQVATDSDAMRGNHEEYVKRAFQRALLAFFEKELPEAGAAFNVMTTLGCYPVQVREGWSVWCTTPHGWPACLFGVVKSDQQFNPGAWPKPWPDPFTAVVEAGKWYREHVGKTQETPKA